MSKIPADVIAMAREVIASYYDETGFVSLANDARAHWGDDTPLLQMPARAVMAERERCAKIAETFNPSDQASLGAQRGIAREIRAGMKP
jgi:hypothetical protein